MMILANRWRKRILAILSRFAIYIILIAVAVALLYMRKKFGIDFFDEAAAIPLEILFGIIIAESYVRKLQRDKRKQQLMYIKGYLFRSQMRNLFIANFSALKSPIVDMAKIRSLSLAELKEYKQSLPPLEYKSDKKIEAVLLEYVAAQQVFHNFMNWAIENEIDGIFDDMIFLLHFIEDVKLFKEHNPKKNFVSEMRKNTAMAGKIEKVLSEGIHSFLDYCIELKQKQKRLFNEIIRDYELSLGIS